MFPTGQSPFQIARILTEEGFASPGVKGRRNASNIKSILTNEKYKGDALLQIRSFIYFDTIGIETIDLILLFKNTCGTRAFDSLTIWLVSLWICWVLYLYFSGTCYQRKITITLKLSSKEKCQHDCVSFIVVK